MKLSHLVARGEGRGTLGSICLIREGLSTCCDGGHRSFALTATLEGHYSTLCMRNNMHGYLRKHVVERSLFPCQAESRSASHKYSQPCSENIDSQPCNQDWL